MTKILEDSINNLFGIKEENADKEVNAIYSKEKANASINNLIDFVIRRLCQLNKPFKYCVTGLHMQNNGAGLNSSGTCSQTQPWPITTPTPTALSLFKGKWVTT